MDKTINKYLSVLIGAITMLLSFSSCTDQDDIDIVYHHEPTIEINTLALYENSGIDVVRFQTLMGTGIYKPCVTVLVYDSEGKLNQKQVFITDDLRPITSSLKDLDEKEYTIISLQHFVIVANGKTSSSWELGDENDLNTVHISVSSLDGNISWFNCLGINTSKVLVKKDTKIEISTQVAGSFVDFKYENFDKSDFNRLGLYFKDKANGLYLNPAYTGNDRYYYKNGFNAPNTWSTAAVFYSSTKLKESEGATRFIFETGNINYCFGPSKQSEDGQITFTAYPSQNAYFNFERGKRYTAFCYYNGGNNNIDTFIGNDTEFVNWYDHLEKWVIPEFEQPYIQWGASVADVKQYMKDRSYELWFDINESNDIYWLGYAGKYKEDNIQYAFSTASNDLLVSMVAIPQSNLNIEQIISIFDNNHEYKRIKLFEDCFQQYGCYIFINDKTQVQIYPDGQWDNGDKFTSVQYYPRTYNDAEALNMYQVTNSIATKKPVNVNIKSVF